MSGAFDSIPSESSASPVTINLTWSEIVNHNQTVDKQGGQALPDPEYYHLTAAEYLGTGTGIFVRQDSPALVTPDLGVPSAGDLSNCTGLPISTGVAGLAAGVALFLSTPSSANLAAAVTDEAGTGTIVFSESPTVNDAFFTGLTTFPGGTSIDALGNLAVGGDLIIHGDTVTMNTSTIMVEDHNIELGVVADPSDVTANGGGITLKGATDKTIIWDSTNSNWTSSEHWNLATGKNYKINNAVVLSGNALGSGIVSSSLTSVGTLTSLAVSGNSTLTGNVGIGGSPLGATGYCSIRGQATGGANVRGFRNEQVIQSDVTTSWYGFFSAPATAAAGFTLGNLSHFAAQDSGIGSGSAITLQVGFNSQLGVGTGKWNFYASGSANNAFAGNVRIGSTTAPTVALDVTGALAVSGNSTLTGLVGIGEAPNSAQALRINTSNLAGSTQYGIVCHPPFTSAATTAGWAIFTRATTAATSFTMGEAVGLYVASTFLGAGSAITNNYGILIKTQSVGTNNYGLVSEVTAAANRWNLFISGNANNAFAGNVRIGSVVAPTVALDVTGAANISGVLTAPTAAIGTYTTQVATTAFVRDEFSVYDELFGSPTLDLDFAGLKTLDSRITFTRGSIGTFWDANGVLQTAASGVPRFTHNPLTGESLGLLIEEMKTNFLARSSEFDGPIWIKSAATIGGVNVEVAPDGTTSADKLVEDNTNGAHQVYQDITKSAFAVTFTSSVFVKAAERTSIWIIPSNTAGTSLAQARFILSGDGSTASVNTAGSYTNASAAIQSVGQGWYRCSLVFTTDTDTLVRNRVRLADGAGNTIYLGDNASGVFIWGAQLEIGSHASSYIPTTTGAVTRATDSATMSGTDFSSWYNNAQGTFVAQFAEGHAYDNAAGDCVLGVSDGSANNHLYVGQRVGATTIRAGGMDIGGVNNTQFIFNTVLPAAEMVPLRKIKAGATFNTNDSAGTVNGSPIQTDNTVTTAAFNQMRFGGRFDTAGGQMLNGTIARVTYWPKRVPNRSLQALTSGGHPSVHIQATMLGTTVYKPNGNDVVATIDTSGLTLLRGLIVNPGGTNAIRVSTTGSIGFHAATPMAKPEVTGSRAGNAALASLLTQLANYGLITDSTTES